MNYKRLVLIFALCNTMAAFGTEDKIIETVEHSNPERLQCLLMPGFLIRLEDKKRYVGLAQDVTNRTFADLHKTCFYDVIKGARCALYVGLAIYFGKHFYDNVSFLRPVLSSLVPLVGNRSGEQVQQPPANAAQGQSQQPPINAAPAQQSVHQPAHEQPGISECGGGIIKMLSDHSAALCGAAFSTYFANKALKEFKEILVSKARQKRHKNALAVETIIQRLPAFDNGCFIPGSLS